VNEKKTLADSIETAFLHSRQAQGPPRRRVNVEACETVQVVSSSAPQLLPSPDPFEEAAQLAGDLIAALGEVIRGRPEAIGLSVGALLSGGHLLIEDVPGVGKTMLAKALARSVGGSFRRVQATPDLVPGELTGISMFSKEREEWQFHPGPLFAHVVLVDEINRATPRTQSALLEAMEERQVTVDGNTHILPDPFFLVATQNPFEYAGTFPLVEGQRDRFALVVAIGHLPPDAERDLLLGAGGLDALDRLEPVTDVVSLKAAIATVRRVHCSPAVAQYIVDLGSATRAHPEVRLGASPRASLAMLQAARAHAVMAGRNYVAPDDVKAVAVASLAHRFILSGDTDRPAGIAVVLAVLESVPVPRG
jgi:MoxR-like ATPase